jgi:hypothetical protein
MPLPLLSDPIGAARAIPGGAFLLCEWPVRAIRAGVNGGEEGPRRVTAPHPEATLKPSSGHLVANR